MDSLALQLRHAIRKLARSPLFTAVALVSLAVGIGANTAIFTVVDGVLLEPLSYPESDRLVWINFTAPGLGYDEIPFSDGAYVHVLEGQRSFEGLAMWSQAHMSLTGDGPPERLAAARVTTGTFSLLGVQPALGRGFRPDEGRPGAEPAVIVSYGLWRRRFGGDPDILGQTIRVDGEPRRVVGVAPRGFAYPDEEIDAWLPFVIDEADLAAGSFSYPTIGRLKPGVTMATAEADI
ncbi:MAG: multidrug ABC transporter substrate-binding protein, partial [Gammaproteobacteria bacterium]|nr:multidrug ABC transporter substrate-binding protein [Gammaproteobacteria bacterium]